MRDVSVAPGARTLPTPRGLPLNFCPDYMKSHLNLLAFAAVALAGCAGAPEMKRGDGPPVKLLVVRMTSSPVAVATYADDFDCHGQTPVMLPNSEGVPLDAPDKPWQTFQFGTSHMGGGVIDSCQGTGSFRTDVAHEYRVEFDEAGTGKCRMRVLSRPAGSQDSMTEQRVEPRETTTPFIDAKGPWCRADGRFSGSSSYLSPRR